MRRICPASELPADALLDRTRAPTGSDKPGKPINDYIDLSFSIWDQSQSGNQLWSEDHDDVGVLDGVYDLALGPINSLTPAMLSGGSLHL